MNARLDPSSMTFEQPKHLKEVQYRREVRNLGLVMIMFLVIVTFSTLFLYGINSWMDQPTPKRSWIILAICPFCWAAFRAVLWFQARSRRFLEFRNDRIFLSSKGEYPIQAVTGWSFAPDILNPAFSVLRISVSYPGFWMKEIRRRKRAIFTTPLHSRPGERWSMLLDNPEEIARLREELSIRCPVRPE